MEAKFGNFSEMANLLSVKSRVSSDLTVLFERFSLGRLLYRMGIRKEQGYSLVQLIMALCIFRVCGETIHSAYMANFYPCRGSLLTDHIPAVRSNVYFCSLLLMFCGKSKVKKS